MYPSNKRLAMSETLLDWPQISIGELLETIIDYRGKTPPKSSSGITTLTSANVRNGRIDLSKVSFVTQDTYDKWITRGLPKPGDVLITTEAPVGEVASLPGDQIYLITRRMMALRGNPKRLHNDYLKYSLMYWGNIGRLLGATRGSTVPRVLKTDITNLKLPIPPLPEQKAIAHILGTLDDKIELNRQMNVTLEAIARAVFKSWFVDFDPVYAKAMGEDPKGMDAETAALFTDAFVETKGGAVPDGWRVEPIGQHVKAQKGLSYKGSGLVDSGIPLHNLNSIYEGGGYKY
ncbi:MAG: restriction endonuclease subunit S [Anaerolineales bacterium]|nr:restriction endonuclease subunit S [Chloroflexota bacterium]MBL6982733.1 restriction endonuclease subunit S [Anaerolineales bacterium]